jgi:hypothetical protein
MALSLSKGPIQYQSSGWGIEQSGAGGEDPTSEVEPASDRDRPAVEAVAAGPPVNSYAADIAALAVYCLCLGHHGGGGGGI